MTTAVSIKNESSIGHDVQVAIYNTNTGAKSFSVILKPTETTTQYVYTGQALEVVEIDNE